MLNTHYMGLDIHKKTISFCIRQSDGTIVQEGTLNANHQALDEWLLQVPQPWVAGMEATMFTGWVYDHLTKHSPQVKVAHPAMLKAISAGKKKNDRVDAQKISDLLRCNYFPECHVASQEIRDRRRVLRYRNLLVRQSVQMKNRVGCMLMETGISYNKQKLHQRRYFNQLLKDRANELPSSMPELLRLSRSTIDGLGQMNKQLLRALQTDEALGARVQRLMTIPGVGQVLSLTWALEMGDISRFPSVKDAISYCGLCDAEQSSGGKSQRTPLSKQRNRYLQTTLVEAAKVATRWHPELALIYEREKQKGHRNRGTLAVARKIVAYLLAIDRSGNNFQPLPPSPLTGAATASK
jgi:transposase